MELRRRKESLKLKARVRARELELARLRVVQNEDKELDAGQGDECPELGNEGAGMGCEAAGFGSGDVGVACGDVGSVVRMLEWSIWLDMVCGRLHGVGMPQIQLSVNLG